METVLVVDFGAQYAQLIARRVREAHVYSEIVPHTITAEELAARRPMGVIFSGGPKSVHVPGRPGHRPGDLRPRRPDPRHLLRRPARRPAARRRGGPHRPGRVRPHRPHAHGGAVAPARARAPGRVDEPLRLDRAGARRLRGHGQHARGAGRRPRARRAADPRRPVPPRGRAHAARPGAPAPLPLRRVRLPADVDDDVGHRRPRWRRSGPRSAASGSSAGSRAASTRRWPPPSSTGPSARSSRACSSTPG